MIAVRQWRIGSGVRSCQSHIRCGPGPSARLRGETEPAGWAWDRRGSTFEDKINLQSHLCTAAGFTIVVSQTFTRTQQIQSLSHRRPGPGSSAVCLAARTQLHQQNVGETSYDLSVRVWRKRFNQGEREGPKEDSTGTHTSRQSATRLRAPLNLFLKIQNLPVWNREFWICDQSALLFIYTYVSTLTFIRFQK